MPRLSIVGTINNSGLGQLCKQYHRMFDVHSQLVIHHKKKGTHLEFIQPGCEIFEQHEACALDSKWEAFCASKPDAVLFFEYPYNWNYIRHLKKRGIKVLFIPMMDSCGTPWFRKEGCIDLVDLYICPTMAAYNVFSGQGLPAIHAPWPIDIDYFKFKQRTSSDHITFVHNVGRGGDGMRKGWDILLQAWAEMDQSQASLIIHSQIKLPNKFGPLLNGVDWRYGDLPEARDLYTDGDVYVSPSRKEGLGLPFREAMSMGMPVIGTDIPPINEVLTAPEQLVRFRKERRIGPVQDGSVYEPDMEDLKAKMRFMMECGDIEARSLAARKVIEDNYSQEIMVPLYETIIEEICKK